MSAQDKNESAVLPVKDWPRDIYVQDRTVTVYGFFSEINGAARVMRIVLEDCTLALTCPNDKMILEQDPAKETYRSVADVALFANPPEHITVIRNPIAGLRLGRSESSGHIILHSGHRIQYTDLRPVDHSTEERHLVTQLKNMPMDEKAASHAKDLNHIDLLTVRQAAEYARVDERTIREWISRRNGDNPMLPGVVKTGRLIRIPRSSLDPWRKATKDTRKPKTMARRHASRKGVKRGS